MGRVARLLINDRAVVVALSTLEKLEALHWNVTVPRYSVVGARGSP